jgi:multidrug transporter EmrE-like cation transporter
MRSASSNIPSPTCCRSASGCVISVAVWIAGLSRVPVSVAYPMLSLGYVVNAALAYWLFGESLSMQKVLGIGFIIVGVFLVARS